MTPHRLAAIDIGTVTTRLLVADVDPDTITEVERSTDITHLGEGLTSTGRLSEAAMDRVENVIAAYATTIDRLGVDHLVAVATSASRDADNASDFASRLTSHGITPEIIEGVREADLTFLGATSQRVGDGILVVDCGGGSTELVLGNVTRRNGVREATVITGRSIDVGSRRLTELFLRSDPPSRAQIDEVRAWVAAEVRPYFERLDERAQMMIAVAGTATTLAAIKLELVDYDASLVDGSVISGSEVSEMLDWLASMPVARRAEVIGLHPQRAGVIVAGALILQTVMALAGLDAMVVSERDILYGILMDTYLHLQESGDEK